MQAMRALQITAPGVVAVVEVPQPVAAAGEALLQVRMVGMCGSDLNTFRGNNPLVSYPRILGHEIAATVVSTPAEASALIGKNVTVSPYTSCGTCASCLRGRTNACRNNQTFGVQRDGALAEYIAVPLDKIVEAERLSIHELALVEPLTIGFHAVARGRVSPGDRVAVFGAGGVGLGAIAGAHARHSTVIAIDLDAAKLDLARAAGAQFTIDSRTEDLHERLSELTGGHGPDVIIEAIGLPQTFRAAVQEVAFTGRVVYIGYAKEPVSYETRLFVQKELDILGSRNATRQDFSEVISMLQNGVFPVKQAISLVVPLQQAAESLAAWSANPGSYSKLMVDVQA